MNNPETRVQDSELAQVMAYAETEAMKNTELVGVERGIMYSRMRREAAYEYIQTQEERLKDLYKAVNYEVNIIATHKDDVVPNTESKNRFNVLNLFKKLTHNAN